MTLGRPLIAHMPGDGGCHRQGPHREEECAKRLASRRAPTGEQETPVAREGETARLVDVQAAIQVVRRASSIMGMAVDSGTGDTRASLHLARARQVFDALIDAEVALTAASLQQERLEARLRELLAEGQSTVDIVTLLEFVAALQSSQERTS